MTLIYWRSTWLYSALYSALLYIHSKAMGSTEGLRVPKSVMGRPRSTGLLVYRCLWVEAVGLVDHSGFADARALFFLILSLVGRLWSAGRHVYHQWRVLGGLP